MTYEKDGKKEWMFNSSTDSNMIQRYSDINAFFYNWSANSTFYMIFPSTFT